MMGISILNLMAEAPIPFDISIRKKGVVHSMTDEQRDPNFDLQVKMFVHTTVLFFFH